MNLSDRQHAAVSAPPGALFVAAAAGSGKTRVLTARFVRLTTGTGDGGAGQEILEPDLGRVAAVTFTEKAAGELSDRIRGALARGGNIEFSRDVDRAWIGTIHGLCARILRRNAFEAGLDPAFRTADEVQSGMLRERAFSEVARELTCTSEPFAQLVSDYRITRVAEDVRHVDEYLRSLALTPNDLVWGEGPAAADTYMAAFTDLLRRYSESYAQLKDELGVLDFEDLQLRTLSLLESSPTVAQEYRRQFVEVMVDEFQDTNQLQLRVAEEISGGRMFSVGDEKQSIYSWRNADVDVFRRRAAEVSADRTFPLPENFRSHPQLVSFFNAVFTRPPFWPDSFLTLESGRADVCEGDGWPEGVPRVKVTLADEDLCKADGQDAEPRIVARELAALRNAGLEQSDMVLLLRAMTRAERFADALRAEGFDVFIASGGTFFETREAQEIRALLEVVANSGNDEAFARLLSGYCANVSDDSLLLLKRFARGRSLFDAASDATRPALPGPDEQAVGRLAAAVERARERLGRVTLYDLIHSLCSDLDLDLVLMSAGDPRGWANVLKFARLAEEFESNAAGDPAALLEYLDARMQHARYEQQAATAAENVDAVRVMSVHAAKGLEFPVVAVAELGKSPRRNSSDFMVGMVKGSPVLGVRLPNWGQRKDRATPGYESVAEVQQERELAEAKRLFYVACTRASTALLLFGTVKPGAERRDRPADWLTQALGIDCGQVGARGTTVDVDGAEISLSLVETPSACAVGETPSAQSIDISAFDAERVTDTVRGASVVPEQISFTGLQRYRTCPYNYYVRDVLRLGARRTAGTEEAVLVGNAVHEALRAVDSSHPPNPTRIRSIARSLGLDEAMSRRTEEAVQEFWRCPIAANVYSGDRLVHEAPFAYLISGSLVAGNIDLISWKQNEAALVDYKTGTAPVTSEAIQRWRRQAECYALAALKAGASHVRVHFVKPESGCVGEQFDFDASEADRLEREIAFALEMIESGAFPPLETFSPLTCPECPALGNLCSITFPRRAASV